MTSKNEPAGIWLRVSSGGQDEVNQRPEVLKHCTARGYRIGQMYELNEKSASKGEQQAKLDEMLADMRDGTIKVLVCWHSDRLERRGPEYVFRLLAHVRDAGGRIESTKEPLFGSTDMSGDAMTALGSVIAHQYSVHLAEQVKVSHDRIRANGAVGPGGTPWGIAIVGQKYEKEYVPTDLCRRYVPDIFERCIAGESCRAIAEWLDSEGVPPKRGTKWHEGSVRKILHNRVYAGRRLNLDGQTIHRCEAVVSADVFDRANQVLKTRPKRGPVKKDNRPMLAHLKCARCADSPMFRIRLRSRNGRYYWYYRCTGRGPQRKGCGNMVAFEQTETIIAARVFLTSTEPYRTRAWVAGSNWDVEISDVMQDIRELSQTADPLSEEFDTRMTELKATLADYRKRETVPGHWVYTDIGMTVGEHFYGLDAAGKREYLKTRDIRVEKATPAEPGATHGVRVVIDGEEHGVFPYPA